MSALQQGVQIVPCLPGESFFKPERLFVAAWFGEPRDVEQLGEGGLWKGTIRRGDVHVIAPRDERTFRKRQAGEYACLFIEPEFLEPLAAAPGALRSHALITDGPLTHLIAALSGESSFGAASALFRESIAQAVVARLLALSEPQASPCKVRALDAKALDRTVEYLRAGPDQPHSLARLAELVQRPAAEFAHAFRSATGRWPHRFQLELEADLGRLAGSAGLTGLTPAERNVVSYLHLGYTNAQIAMACGSSPRTVRNQLSSAYAKLGVSSRAEAVSLLVRHRAAD